MARKRGRPSTLDREQALERAMELFWARGYEGTTLEDLQSAMGGISPPSFYNAFGSKEQLFREAADLYVRTMGEPTARALQQGKTARAGIEAMLRTAAESFSQPGRPAGCMILLGATKCTPANRGAQEHLQQMRRQTPEFIKQRLDRGLTEGDLPPGTDTGGIAHFFATIVQGLGVRASDGATRAELMAAVDGAMAAWPSLARARSLGNDEMKIGRSS
jgi:AcrR family transcriptional regulator